MPTTAARLLVIGGAITAVAAAEPVDLEMVGRIRQEAIQNSEVMDTVWQLTDAIGPRLTGSPQLKRANEWTRDKLVEWGLSNPHLEGYEFGRGWSFSRVSVHMVEPYEQPLIALPRAWTRGTKGRVRGPVVRADLDDDEDLEKHKGELKGKIVLLSDAKEVEPPTEPSFNRYSDEDLENLRAFRIREPRSGDWRKRLKKRLETRKKRADYLRDEGVLATINVSSWNNGIIRTGSGGSYDPQDKPAVTALTMSVEHYNRLLRLLDEEIDVELEIEVEARFHDKDTKAYNTIAEIPGSDPDAGIVMIGAHLDSWHPGTGATDDAGGCAVAMEAMRILKALEVEPKRTIRVALWTGEEQGLYGSRHHVERHFVEQPLSDDPEQLKLPRSLRDPGGPRVFKDDFERFSVYFNLDNGAGKIRGIYAQQNMPAQPIFEAWLAPFSDLGAGTVTQRDTSSTDHRSFDRVGLPGFQFIQDRLEYFTRTHHSNMDVYDYLQKEDLIQSSAVVASFLYHAAMRDGRFPRKPLPPDAYEELQQEDEHEQEDRQE